MQWLFLKPKLQKQPDWQGSRCHSCCNGWAKFLEGRACESPALRLLILYFRCDARHNGCKIFLLERSAEFCSSVGNEWDIAIRLPWVRGCLCSDCDSDHGLLKNYSIDAPVAGKIDLKAWLVARIPAASYGRPTASQCLTGVSQADSRFSIASLAGAKRCCCGSFHRRGPLAVAGLGLWYFPLAAIAGVSPLPAAGNIRRGSQEFRSWQQWQTSSIPKPRA
jgi:hypothetical protein